MNLWQKLMNSHKRNFFLGVWPFLEIKVEDDGRVKNLMPLLPHYVCLKALMLTFFVGSKKDMFYALDPCSMLMPFP